MLRSIPLLLAMSFMSFQASAVTKEVVMTTFNALLASHANLTQFHKEHCQEHDAPKFERERKAFSALGVQLEKSENITICTADDIAFVVRVMGCLIKTASEAPRAFCAKSEEIVKTCLEPVVVSEACIAALTEVDRRAMDERYPKSE